MTSRVLIIHPSNEWYGADQMLDSWVAALIKNNVEVQVLLPTDVTYNGELQQRLIARGCSVELCDLPILRRRELTPKGVLRLTRRLATTHRLVRRCAKRADLVILSTAAVVLASLPSIGTGRKRIVHVQEFLAGGVEGRALSSLLTLMCSVLVCCSSAVRDGLQPRARRKAKIIHNGIPDTDVIHDWSASEVQGQPAITLVGRIQGWKGQDAAVKMLAEPCLKDHPARPMLILVGAEPPGEEGVYLPGLKILAREANILDRIEFRGQLEPIEVADLIARSNVVLNTSQKADPFPLASLEAMRAASAVVAGNIGGLPEMLEDAGILVSPDSPADLAKAVCELLDDHVLSARLGRAARQRWLSNFDTVTHQRNLTELFQSLGIVDHGRSK
ncbi:glycosyltransferase family 4 protein [Rhodococcus fascians]|nr:glycosyltransferase family 4 protein [Rhodococcus fascians]MBY4113882.1 glycosyltransferase family 4 protein [Rhodococcus fascians]